MNRSAHIGHLVRGQVDASGRLIEADEPLRRLHFQAGGREGGKLAIPALATIADLTRATGVRLARPAFIAGVDEDINVWVETSFADDIVHLSLLNWHARPRNDGGQVGSAQAPESPDLIARFDPELTLIAIKGPMASGLARQYIGQGFTELVRIDGMDQMELLQSLGRFDPLTSNRVTLKHLESQFSMRSGPEYAQNGEVKAYRCEFARLDMTDVDPAEALVESGGVGVGDMAYFFGRQLGPALQKPLGRIIANAETIGNKLRGPIRENYAVYARDIADAARHLNSLVDDLSDLEIVENENFTAAKDQIELGDIARRITGLMALKAADHHMKLNVYGDTPVSAVAEFRRVIQIMLNLVTNAIRYSPDSGEVGIEIADGPEFATLSVWDQGKGIEEEDREKIFLKFERLGRSGDGGSGLGLYISRRLARFMGGDLTVERAKEGGAKFILRLPKK